MRMRTILAAAAVFAAAALLGCRCSNFGRSD
jgi:hypothetical protein